MLSFHVKCVQTDRHTDGQTDNDKTVCPLSYAPDLSIWGHKNLGCGLLDEATLQTSVNPMPLGWLGTRKFKHFYINKLTPGLSKLFGSSILAFTGELDLCQDVFVKHKWPHNTQFLKL